MSKAIFINSPLFPSLQPILVSSLARNDYKRFWNLNIQDEAIKIFVDHLSIPALIQKIIIILIALCFIPILLFVYLPSKISVNDPMKIAYDIIKFQTALGGFLTSENISTTCSTP